MTWSAAFSWIIRMHALDSELRRLGLGYVRMADWLHEPAKRWETDPLVSNYAIAGYHHMGTARMGDTPENGVTDADARVHGVDNLYIAGSAVFPTGGWANPTVTILVLTLRLADKLKAESAPVS